MQFVPCQFLALCCFALRCIVSCRVVSCRIVLCCVIYPVARYVTLRYVTASPQQRSPLLFLFRLSLVDRFLEFVRRVVEQVKVFAVRLLEYANVFESAGFLKAHPSLLTRRGAAGIGVRVRVRMRWWLEPVARSGRQLRQRQGILASLFVDRCQGTLIAGRKTFLRDLVELNPAVRAIGPTAIAKAFVVVDIIVISIVVVVVDTSIVLQRGRQTRLRPHRTRRTRCVGVVGVGAAAVGGSIRICIVFYLI
mmetsp:Transcript_4604/g.10559  ORF Transcript_4604/g.10559 Transcript_4604/m.10559 type:complete len:250 (+) Transcript_4604:2505-3254(+)